MTAADLPGPRDVPMSQSSGHAAPEPRRCVCPPADHWTAELAHLCTSTPGVLTPITGYYQALCPPERGCTDAVAHRCEGTNWHTADGGTVADWYASRQATYQQLTLEAA